MAARCCRPSSAQLTGALAAMRLADRKNSRRYVENHLLIHDLAAPVEQQQAFADCLEGLAKAATRWEQVHFLTQQELLELQREQIRSNWSLRSQLSLHAQHQRKR